MIVHTTFLIYDLSLDYSSSRAFAKDLDTTVGLFKVVDVIGFRHYSPSWLRLAFAVPTSIVWSLAES